MSDIGIDEAGRGALAGPVVAACVHIPTAIQSIPEWICDSKQLSSNQRNKAFEWIKENCTYTSAAVSARYIDTHGIKKATQQAMKKALKQITCLIKTTHAFVDGNDNFDLTIPTTYIIRGDAAVPCISAASIIAKVTRDGLMNKYDALYPNYQFSLHKGYGTKKHYLALEKFGRSPLHRDSFLRTLEANIQKYTTSNKERD